MGLEAFTVEGELKLNKEGFESDLKGAQSSALSFMDVFKGNILSNAVTGAFSKITSGITGALSKGLGAVKSFVSDSVSAFGEFEQLAGGVETLFGNASRSAANYAEDIASKVATANELFGNYDTSGYWYDSWMSDKYAERIAEVGKMTKKEEEKFIAELESQYDQYADYIGMSEAEITAKAEKEYSDRAAAQELVMNNAKNAWKTAGLSMNAYMETVTGFSASLAQSLNNDQLKTAEYADRALSDMSDNANKMGSNMGSIMNAYMGFSKQNYTMLTCLAA